MNSLKKSIQTFTRLSQSERADCLEAMWLCGWAQIAIRIFPFRWIAKWLGEPQMETNQQNGLARGSHLVGQVRQSIGIASRRLPWKCLCLVRAMVAKSMLDRRGCEGTVYFGLRKSAQAGNLEAHAWTRCGDQIVTGGEERRGHVVVATFAFGPENEGRSRKDSGVEEKFPSAEQIFDSLSCESP